MKEKSETMRLDRALAERGLVSSRTRAQELLKGGGVSVNGNVVTEADFRVAKKDKIALFQQDIPWVSRGGLKLDYAFTHWRIDPKGKVALDIGASTGGFTDVLLTRGAKKVYALDVGHGQLADKIKKNEKVVNMEGVHVKDVTKKHFKERLGVIVIDVSFISLEKVLPTAKGLLGKGGVLIALVKPQFEVGKAHIKKGIVTDPKMHLEVMRRIETVAHELGFSVDGVMSSPIAGGDGNKEFLMCARMAVETE